VKDRTLAVIGLLVLALVAVPAAAAPQSATAETPVLWPALRPATTAAVVAAEGVLVDSALTREVVALVAGRLRACGVAVLETRPPTGEVDTLVAISVRRRVDSLDVLAAIFQAGEPRLALPLRYSPLLPLPDLVAHLMGQGLAQLCPAR
jgi:hypothetical protein